MLNINSITKNIFILLSIFCVGIYSPLKVSSEIYSNQNINEINIKDLESLKKLANEAEKKGDLKKELKFLTLIIKTIPEYQNYQIERNLYFEVLENYSNAPQTQDPSLLRLMGRIAIINSLLGEYELAINLLKEITIISEKYINTHISDISFYYSELGYIYDEIGNLSKAEDVFEKSLAINKKKLGEYHPETATDFNNLGVVYSNQGQYEKAEKYFEKSLNIQKKISPKDKTSWITALLNLGGIYEDLYYYYYQDYGKYSGYLKKAKTTKLDAYKLAKKYLNEDDDRLPTTINNLGLFFSNVGNNKKAIKFYKEAILILRKNLGEKHPELAITLNNLSLAQLDINEYEKALDNAKKALEIYTEFYGLTHPDTSLTLNNIAGIYRELGENEKANAFARKGMEIEFRLIQQEAPFLVQDERLDYVESFGYGPDMAYSQALHSSSGLELAFFVRLNRQGLLEDIERKQSQLIKLSENNLSIVKKLRQITNKLSSTVITDDERYELVLQRDLLERKIYRILPKINSQIVDANIISKKLPPKSILIEFQKYYPHKPLSKPEEIWGDPRYIALLLYDDGKSKSFDLGLAEPIELKIREALRASEEMLINAQDLWNEVGKLIIAPLENLLGEAETIFISPDAELNRVPFSSISSHVDKELFGEAINLRILTTGRELLTLFDKSENSYKQALVIANPNFDNKKELVLKKEEFLLDLPIQSRSMDLESVVWNQLPGTSREGKEIAKLTDAKYLTKEKATALAIQKYNSPRILHIASHAYYLTNQDELENPLLRSGIVLAGANQPDLNPYDDGYLTALEVTKLDLEGTELAVISGCESGKGDFQSGEGVYGLKRALAVAGSRSSLLSLWKVDDYGTALFMESFYEKLKEGKSRSKALSDTQKEFREHPLPGFRHPGIWAAFVLSGDWRQIKF